MMRRIKTKGFSLLEALVSLGIAGMVLGGFYEALSTGSRLEKRADDQASQVLVATQILDRMGVDFPLRTGFSDNGQINGFDWEVVVGEVPPPDMEIGPILPGELLFVAVTVSDPGGAPPVILRSIKYTQVPL
ncbi:MAG: prepilin-type N-terminal cleavage/methylation domain-containing protein [Pseudomonadota bacterium]